MNTSENPALVTPSASSPQVASSQPNPSAPQAPFVLFAGAGVSAAAPACLPGWWALNDAILRALFDRITEGDVLTPDQRTNLLEELKTLRQERRFPPDYQADFMEEEAGLDYFRALQVLDRPTPNALHRAVARLAARGRIAAIVTTNFDQLFEIALREQGVTPALAYDAATFEQLAVAPADGLPVIKVHGTVTGVESMIDTRKQRRRGRARALLHCLESLFRAHPLVVAGFSGEDLDNDANYLGLHAARNTCPGLLWLVHPPGDEIPALKPGTEYLKPGAKRLVESYPRETTRVVVGVAAEIFAAWSGLEVEAVDTKAAQAATAQHGTAYLRQWAGSLDLPLAVTMAAALCEAAGHRPVAHKLIRGAWNRGIDQNPGRLATSRQRFLRAHARVRLRRGRYDDPELGETLNQLDTMNDDLAVGLRFLRNVMRSSPSTDLSGAVETLASVEAGDTASPADIVDAGLAIAYAGTITDLGPECLDYLEQCRQVARADGDDVREALCGLEIALRLTKAGRDPERAAELTHFAGEVAASIRDGRLQSGIALRNALAMDGVHMPRRAEEFAAASFAAALADELRLHMARSAIFWLRLAAREDLDFAGAIDAYRALNADDLGPLAADAELAFVEYALRHGNPGGLEHLRLLVELAPQRGLPWYAAEVERIRTLAPG